MLTNIRLGLKSSQYMLFLKLIFFLLPATSFNLFALPEDAPFWRTKEKVLARITNERAIVVTVKAIAKGKGQSQLLMHGGGLTRISHDLAFQRATQYEELKKISDHIREVRWNSQQSMLYVHTEAFRYHARMHMKITTEKPSPKVNKIRFRVVEGNFKGMEGVFTFEDYRANEALMGFYSTFDYKKLPMPEFFVRFGLEVVLQKVAGLMRTQLEKPN